VKRYNKILILLAVVGWLFPSISSAAASPIAANQPTGAPVALTQPEIKVITAPQLPPISTTVVASSMASCTSSSELGNAALNLNLPAGCFNLSLGRRVETQPKVSVVSYDTAAISLSVASPALYYKPNRVLPALPNPSVPALPLPSVSLVLALGLIGTAPRARALAKKLQLHLQPSLSLSQLQILRC